MTYVAFLRAVNVGGKGLLRMADLVDAGTAAGCGNVRTFQAAGNVIFEAPPTRVAAIARRLQQQVSALLGVEAGLTIRSVEDLRAILRAAPFGALTADRALKLYVVFLLAAPRRKVAYPIGNEKEALEAIGARPTEVFVVSRRKPRGLMYGFPNAFVEDALGVPATSRGWSTVAKIVERATRQTTSDRVAAARPGGRAGSRSRAS
jgi:uncharacterized protein (DUF1697 family)